MTPSRFPLVRKLSTFGLFAVVLTALVGCSRGTPAEAKDQTIDADADSEQTVQVHVFDDEGQLVGPVSSPKIERSEAQWRKRLTQKEFLILRQHGTERPGSGELLANKEEGVYTCAGCELPLFHSRTKYNSRTGWPSFYKPIAPTNVKDVPDHSLGMVRTENVCPRCDSHLGHVFEDGPEPTGLRYCINSVAMNFTPQDKLVSLAEPAASQHAEGPTTHPAQTTSSGQPKETAMSSENLKSIVLAGGCFWCTEVVFEHVQGVKEVVSGYAGGKPELADYDSVSHGKTDHAEVIKITYDPDVVDFEKLLEIFFTVAHDPTQLNRQGPDVGKQYRSAFFYENEAQKQAVERYIKKLEESGKYNKPIVTTLEPLNGFWPAEAYHQDYVQKNPNNPYVMFNAKPKVQKLKKQYPEEYEKQ